MDVSARWEGDNVVSVRVSAGQIRRFNKLVNLGKHNVVIRKRSEAEN
jgi:environmental stress-induced protein Ves